MGFCIRLTARSFTRLGGLLIILEALERGSGVKYR